jgi:translocation and assembly module TamA
MWPLSLSFRVLLGTALFAPGLACAALNYSVRINAPAEIEALLRDHLELIERHSDPDMDQPLLDELVRGTPDEVMRLIETQGYFNAKVSVREGAPHEYVVSVEPGEPVLIDDVTIRLTGPIRNEADFQKRFADLLEAWPLPIGAPFHQDDWDSGKRITLRLIAADRFPKAKIISSEAFVDSANGKATLAVVVDSGPKVRFGPILPSGLKRYSPSLVRGLADFRQGDPYQLSKLLSFQSALEQDPHFGGAIVSADMEQIQGDEVPVQAAVTELPRKKFEAGLTFSNADGGGVRLAFEHYDVFRRGLVGSVLADVKRNDKTYSFGLALPRDRKGHAYSLNASFKDSDIEGVRSQTAEAGVWRLRRRGPIDSRIGLELLNEHRVEGGVDTRQLRAVLLSGGWTRRELDDPLHPRDGTLIDMQLSGTLGGLSSTSFVRAYGRLARYWTPGATKYGTLVARGELGQVWASNADNVPSTRLFRTGGAGKVRGYDVDSLGVPGPNNSVVGGRVVAIASLEYQIPVTRTISFALFSDMGNATDSWRGFKFERGDGIGVRWASPIAPLAFDVARAERDGSLRWYVGLGAAF